MKKRGPHIEITAALQPMAQARVLYADTDKMGIVYHASYLRYLELGRVELIRSTGMPYTELEARGLALPLTDVVIKFSVPARYDDLMTVNIGLSGLTRVRVAFQYRVTVEDVTILTAQTRHCCVRLADARPDRLPPEVYEVLRSCYTDPGS